jgi:hypothetical protein
MAFAAALPPFPPTAEQAEGHSVEVRFLVKEIILPQSSPDARLVIPRNSKLRCHCYLPVAIGRGFNMFYHTLCPVHASHL